MTEGVASALLSHLKRAANADGWQSLLAPFGGLKPPPVSLHLAVLVEPYLGFILRGAKTVESRFSVRPGPPYQRVARGDIVLLKASGGPIVGAFTASAVWSYRLDPSSWDEVRREFAVAMCAQDGFWEDRSAAEYATLLRVSEVRRLHPMTIPKKDRRGWVVLANRQDGNGLL